VARLDGPKSPGSRTERYSDLAHLDECVEVADVEANEVPELECRIRLSATSLRR